MRILVMRHGQTTGNIGRIVESRAGGKLTDLGIEQAKATAEKLKDEPIDYIYSSDLQRCVETAGYVRQYHPDVPFAKTELILELYKGVYEGGTWDDLPDYIQTDTYVKQPLRGGESWTDMELRVRQFLHDIYNSDHKTVLVVGHDGVLKVMRTIFDNQPLAQSIKLFHDNAQICEWQINEPVSLAAFAG